MRRRNPNETKHKLRLACGNGLRPDIWEEFKTRFRIPLILEFYAATEGNVMMFNFEGKTGAVGRLPWFLEHRFPDGPGQVRRRDRAAGAERGRLLHPVRAERGRRSDRQDRQRCQQARQPLRRLCAARGHRKEDPAPRLRAERHLVPHRRPDAQGRERLFLFRRPDRRHLPLEGRECFDLGSRRGDQHAFPASRTPTSMASAFRAAKAAPAWR